jgi:Predicted membrane protein (DUF2079)
MTRSERWWCLGLFLVGSALLYGALRSYYFVQQLDSVYAVEMLDSLTARGVPETRLTRSVVEAIEKYLPAQPEAVCQSPLSVPSPATFSAFSRHAYFFQYFLLPFRLFFSSEAVIAAAHAANFAGIPVVVYAFLRRRGLPRHLALLFGLLVVAYPGWSQGLFGQYYSDRFVMLFGLVFLFLVVERLEGEKHNIVLILAVGLAAAATTERSALLLGFVALAIVALFPKRAWRQHLTVPLAAFGATAVAFAAIYLSFFVENSDYASFGSSLGNFFQELSNDVFVFGVQKFLLINAVFLLLAAAAGPRLGLLAWVSVVPNLVGNIAGAEKLGWSTHYHAGYFPILIGVAAIGFAALSGRSGVREIPHLMTAVVVVAIPLMATINPYPSSRLTEFSMGVVDRHGLVVGAGYYVETGASAPRNAAVRTHRELRDLVPEQSSVTTPEAYMPALFDGRTLDYYPIGIDSADYAVLPYSRTESGVYSYGGAVSYQGADAQLSLNECLYVRLERAGYNVRSPLVEGGVAVLTRVDAGADKP